MTLPRTIATKICLSIGVVVFGLSNTAIAAGIAGKPQPRNDRTSPRQRSTATGARVEEVIPNTAAARAGIRPGDLIVAINGSAVKDFSDVDAFVAASVGHPMTIDIDRGGSHLRVRAAPTLALVQNPYFNVQQRWVLGVVRTEFRFISCTQEPDCE